MVFVKFIEFRLGIQQIFVYLFPSYLLIPLVRSKYDPLNWKCSVLERSFSSFNDLLRWNLRFGLFHNKQRFLTRLL